jgi:hypothetical protein
MGNNCMVCGEECKVIECAGNIKDMEISFCDEHASYCENCETVICKKVRKVD